MALLQKHLKRKHIEHLEAEGRKKAAQCGLDQGGVVAVQLGASPVSWRSPIAKHIADDVKESLVQRLGAESDDLILISAGDSTAVSLVVP